MYKQGHSKIKFVQTQNLSSKKLSNRLNVHTIATKEHKLYYFAEQTEKYCAVYFVLLRHLSNQLDNKSNIVLDYEIVKQNEST